MSDPARCPNGAVCAAKIVAEIAADSGVLTRDKRARRTVIQGVATLAVLAAAGAVWDVVSSGNLDPKLLAVAAAQAAGTAVAAYFHKAPTDR